MTLTPFTVTAEEMPRVYKLVYRCYLQSGYCTEDASEELKHFPKLDGIKETLVFGLDDEHGELQATNSATVDGSRGLHTDFAFPYETDDERIKAFNGGQRLGSSWRICTNPDNRNAVRAILGIIDYTLRIAGPMMDVCLFTFHPDHAGTYARLLGLERIAGPKPDETVRGAPAMLMRGEVKRMRDVWYNGAGRRI